MDERKRLVSVQYPIRTIVRRLVGGLFTWIVTLILLSSLLFDLLASSFVTETGAVDTENTKGEMFFLLFGAVAGFRGGRVISLLGQVPKM